MPESHGIPRNNGVSSANMVVKCTRCTPKTKKSTEFLQCFCAPAGIELLNLWNDFRRVVKFIDENPWIKPMLAKIEDDKSKNRGVR